MAARFGARYGVGVKRRVLKIELVQRQKHFCPLCGFKKLKRTSAGIYYCGKCEKKIAGGTYIPRTMVGKTIEKIVSQKSFLPSMAQLLEITEQTKEGEEELTE